MCEDRLYLSFNIFVLYNKERQTNDTATINRQFSSAKLI